MSSGSLPFATYHRAAQIGAGTYGSVLTVYNEDGDEFALKLFIQDDDEENDDDDDVVEEDCSPIADLGALREISCLRLFRGDNEHKNIVSIADIQSEWADDKDAAGAGTAGCLGMALPLYPAGDLLGAIEKKTIQSRSKKVEIAHGLLSAVACLHDNGILHRDIKSDNVLLTTADDNSQRAVLIDFSLAKMVDTVMCGGVNILPIAQDEETKHTGEVGTVTYTAPEVVALQPYHYPMDLWSVGVVLLELLQNEPLAAMKNKQAAVLIDETLATLADQPFPDLIRGLLRKDPADRLTARQALEHPLFGKFGLQVPPVRILNMSAALPFEDDDDDELAEEQDTENPTPNFKKATTPRRNRVLERRVQQIDRWCSTLDAVSPITRHAALMYSQQLFQLDDTLDDTKSSQSLLDCVVLAYRFWEVNVLDFKEMHEATKGPFASWNLPEYVDNEATLFMILDYCLYPRQLTK